MLMVSPTFNVIMRSAMVLANSVCVATDSTMPPAGMSQDLASFTMPVTVAVITPLGARVAVSG